MRFDLNERARCVFKLLEQRFYFASRYMAIFGAIGVLFNPAKGLVLLKVARVSKESSNIERRQNNEYDL